MGRDAYYMYRDLSLTPIEKETISRHQLRYNVTIIPPFTMGLEFVKTYGHDHTRVNPKLRYTYPEMHEVLEGDAHYLLQRGQNEESVNEVSLVKATRGDKVIVPPNYGHVTINPRNERARWSTGCAGRLSQCESRTRSFVGGYYELINGRLLHNRAYHHVPEVRVAYPVEVPDQGLVRGKPMYELVGGPLLEFLTAPERHTRLFQELFNR